MGLFEFWMYGNFLAGPGCSSLGVGAFSENGPFRPSGEVLVRNQYSWNRGMKNLFICFWVCCLFSWVNGYSDLYLVFSLICRSKYVVLGVTNWSWVFLCNWFLLWWGCKWQDHRHASPIWVFNTYCGTLYQTSFLS